MMMILLLIFTIMISNLKITFSCIQYYSILFRNENYI